MLRYLEKRKAARASTPAFTAERHQVALATDQLPDPSRILKIAADAFPKLRILATGSSTLAATRKFRDSLTGKKRNLALLPVLLSEMESFGITDLRKLLETLLRQSGGMVEAVSLAKASGLSRPTMLTYMEVFELTHVLHVLRPYHGGGKQEIVKQPKAYGFDTGFVRYTRGWNDLREEDCGILWEHVILDLLLTLPAKEIRFWRDKRQREIDFVIPRGRGECDAFECKWNAAAVDWTNFRAFREDYPKGRNIVVCPKPTGTTLKKSAGLEMLVTDAMGLISILGSRIGGPVAWVGVASP